MTRFLFVVPPLVGHTNPLAAVAGELLGRGHEVAWAGYGDQIRALAGPGAQVYECAMPDGGLSRPPGLAGPAAFQPSSSGWACTAMSVKGRSVMKQVLLRKIR
ncbi:glycosyltransferase, partial [Streptomyces niveus]